MPLYSINDVLEIVDIGSSELDANSSALTIQLKGPTLSEDETDAESLETAPVFGALGLVARPYPADDSGNVQAAFIRGANVVVGMRDTRSASVVGKLKPGDVCLHSTGPEHASRLFLKEEKKQVVLVSKDSNDKDMVVSLDGQGDKITITGFKCAFEMSRAEGIKIGNDKAFISIGVDGTIWVNGGKVILGSAPKGTVLTSVPGVPPSVGSAPGPVVGVLPSSVFA